MGNQVTAFSKLKKFISNERFIVLAIFVLALLVRIKFAWPALNGAQGFIQGDDDDYFRLAINFLQTGRLVDHTVAYRMPLFPMMLAVIYSIFGPVPHYAFPFLILLGALTAVGTYFLGRGVFSQAVGIVAGLLICFDINIIHYNRVLMTETLFIFLTLLAMLALEQLSETKRWQWAFITGILFGLAVLTRVNLVLFIPFLLIWIYLKVKAKDIRAVKIVSVVALLIGSLWLAWVGRNYLELGEFIPFTTQAGRGYYGVYNDIASNPTDKAYYGQWANLSLPDYSKDWNEVGLDKWQRRQAWAWIRKHPQQAIEISLMQIIHFWKPEYRGIIRIKYYLLLFSSIVGLIWAIRRGYNSVVIWAVMFVALTITAVLTLGAPRF